jgi:Uma2 family endonuclease
MRSVQFEEVDAASIRPLRRTEYDRLVESGAFEHERIELLEGKLVAMSARGRPHVYGVTCLNRALVLALGERSLVQTQGPVAASDDSEPEPDIAVLAPGDYLDDHPRTALLVIEVAESSRRVDLGLKARLYAQMAVPDYWVLDLERRELVVHRRPEGERYREVRTFGETEKVSPLEFADAELALASVLPPR